MVVGQEKLILDVFSKLSNSVSQKYPVLRQPSGVIMLKKIQYFSIFLVLLLTVPRLALAQENALTYQPVIVKGAQLADFLGAPVNELSLWAFDVATGTWHAVPFQIDERKPSGSYFGSHDGLLDANDELVFMLKDLGDQAPDHQWIADAASQKYPRCELSLSGAAGYENRYLYLYRAPTPAAPPYMAFHPTPAPGTIASDQYTVGFGPNGLPNKLVIPASAGGSGQDLLDRLKIRIVAQVKGFSGYTTVQINENSILVQGIKLRVGPVRIIRDLIFKLSVNLGSLGSIAPPDTFYFPIFFYPYSMGIQADSVDLKDVQDLNIKIQAVRYSMDFSPAASGMTFSNPHNAAVPVDGQPDTVTPDMSAGLTYQMVTGSQGTVISVLEVPDVGNQRQLYYWENITGSTEDGTRDTGDSLSYADAGFWIRGQTISGILKFWSTVYFLPGNQPPTLAQQFLSTAENPFQVVAQVQRSTVSVSEPGNGTQPQHFAVFPAYPNPFRPGEEQNQVAIRYFLPAREVVQVTVYDITGRVLKQLTNATQPAGFHTVRWNGRSRDGLELASGIYFYRVQAGTRVFTQKILLVR